MNQRLKEALRRKIASHNRLVRLSTIGAVLGVAIMWGFLYFLANWLPVFFVTIVKGVDAEVPANLHRSILVFFTFWMLVGLIDRLVRARRAESLNATPMESALGTLLIPPRVTFSIWDNVRNRIWLSEYELEHASDFLERLYARGKMQMQSVPVELPDEHSRERILTALRLTDLVRELEVKKTDYLALTHPERVAAFVDGGPDPVQGAAFSLR